MTDIPPRPAIIEALKERIDDMPRLSAAGFGIRNSDRDLMVAALIEIQRLNKWANDFSDAQLKERLLAEEQIKVLIAVAEAAEEFRDKGTVLTSCDRGPCQRVVERRDGTDPQAKLFHALAAWSKP